MQLSNIRKTVKGEYGREYSTTEDPLFTDLLLNNFVNQAHRDAALWARLYEQDQTYTIRAKSGGVSTVPLHCNVIDVIPRTVEMDYNLSGAWVRLYPMDEGPLRRAFGAFNGLSAGIPEWYYFRSGDTAGAEREMVLVPGVATAITDGLKLRACIFPSLMSLDTDSPAFQPAEHARLFNRIKWYMACLDVSRGRTEMIPARDRLEAASLADFGELRETLTRFRRPHGTRHVHMVGCW